jgi:hypothetical protein
VRYLFFSVVFVVLKCTQHKKFAILGILSGQFCAIKDIHIVRQLSPIPRLAKQTLKPIQH